MPDYVADAQAAAAFITGLRADLSATEQTLAETIQQAREGLVPIPTPGEEWDAAKSYITGDTVTRNGVHYTAIHYSKGKDPGSSTGYWVETPVPGVQAWEDIPEGSVVEVGARCTYEGKTWECTSQHIKSAVYKPKAGSSKWKEAE